MWQPILFSVMAGLITIIGVLMVRAWRQVALRYSHYINSFAAGIILTAAVTVLLPRAADSVGERAGLYALAGFLAFLLLETFLIFHSGSEVHYEARTQREARGLVFFWGLSLHSLLDGVVIAVGFATSPRLGMVTTLAVVSHELPEGITTFSLLADRLAEKTALGMALAVAVATPLGGLIGAVSLPALTAEPMGAALALVAGSFLYIAATDIVPEIREEHPAGNIACMVLGVLFIAVVHLFVHH